MPETIAITVAVVTLLLGSLERLLVMWLCLTAARAGRGVRWRRGWRPCVEIDTKETGVSDPVTREL